MVDRNNRHSPTDCPYDDRIRDYGESLAVHQMLLEAHDKSLSSLSASVSKLSDSVSALAVAVAEHNARDEELARQRAEETARFDKLMLRRQWVLGIAISIVIACRDWLSKAIRWAYGL